MKLATVINLLFIAILTLGFIDQHTNCLISKAIDRQEMQGHPVNGDNLCSHQLIDIEHGDDILSDLPALNSIPVFTLIDTIAFITPSPVPTAPSPAWQPPEIRS